VNWTQNGSLVSTTAAIHYLVTSNETVVANFVNASETLATDNAGDPV